MMAMRQQRVAAAKRPRQSIRTTYEDFEPHIELMEENDAHIIHIQLPGFEKEQVRITFVHAPGVIRVHGQRPLGNNIWRRFNQTFPLPQNCHESKIHGKFSSGLLTITLPKEFPKADPDIKEAEAATKPIQDAMLKTTSAGETKPHKDKDHIHAPTSFEKPAVQPNLPKLHDLAIHPTAIPTAAAKDPQVNAGESEAQTRIRSIQAIEKTQDNKDNEAGFVSAATLNEKQRDGKRVISLSNTASRPKPQKVSDEIPPNAMTDEKTNADYQKEVGDRYITEANDKWREPKNVEKVVDMLLSEGKETMTHGESSSVADMIDRIAPNANLDQVKKKSERFGKEKAEKDRAAASQGGMNNLDKWINDEEKQLLVNVGVAVLVLVALGAYTTCSLWRPGKSKN